MNPLGQGAIYDRVYTDTLPTASLPAATSAIVVNSSDTVNAGTVLNYDNGAWYHAGDTVDTTGLHAVVYSFRSPTEASILAATTRAIIH